VPARPDNASSAAHTCVTSVLYHPLAFGLLVGAALRVGGVSSMLMPPTLVLAVLPAASTADPWTLWSAPSPRCAGPLTVSIPESVSLPVNETVTSPRYQPNAFAARSGAPVMVGAVLSMFTVAVALVELPALSLAVPVTLCASPSVVMVRGSEQLSRPERPVWSSQAKETATSVLFHPCAFFPGAWLAVMPGVDRSISTVADCASSLLPALSTDQ
jgi:hypothetical protein